MDSAPVLVLLGVFATSLIAFFAWLGTRVIDMRERIIKIEMNIESLLGTRTEQKAAATAGTARRLDDLERPAGDVHASAIADAKIEAADETAAAATDKAGEIRKATKPEEGE